MESTQTQTDIMSEETSRRHLKAEICVFVSLLEVVMMVMRGEKK